MGVKEGPCDWMRDVNLWLVGPATWVLRRDLDWLRDVWFVGPASGVLKRDHVVE